MVGIAPGERRRLARTKAGMNVPANKMIQQYSQAVEVPQGYFGTSHRSREQPQASVLTFESTPQPDPAYFGDFSGISTVAYLTVSAAAGAAAAIYNSKKEDAKKKKLTADAAAKKAAATAAAAAAAAAAAEKVAVNGFNEAKKKRALADKAAQMAENFRKQAQRQQQYAASVAQAAMEAAEIPNSQLSMQKAQQTKIHAAEAAKQAGHSTERAIQAQNASMQASAAATAAERAAVTSTQIARQSALAAVDEANAAQKSFERAQAEAAKATQAANIAKQEYDFALKSSKEASGAEERIRLEKVAQAEKEAAAAAAANKTSYPNWWPGDHSSQINSILAEANQPKVIELFGSEPVLLTKKDSASTTAVLTTTLARFKNMRQVVDSKPEVTPGDKALLSNIISILTTALEDSQAYWSEQTLFNRAVEWANNPVVVENILDRVNVKVVDGLNPNLPADKSKLLTVKNKLFQLYTSTGPEEYRNILTRQERNLMASAEAAIRKFIENSLIANQFTQADAEKIRNNMTGFAESVNIAWTQTMLDAIEAIIEEGLTTPLTVEQVNERMAALPQPSSGQGEGTHWVPLNGIRGFSGFGAIGAMQAHDKHRNRRSPRVVTPSQQFTYLQTQRELSRHRAKKGASIDVNAPSNQTSKLRPWQLQTVLPTSEKQQVSLAIDAQLSKVGANQMMLTQDAHNYIGLVINNITGRMSPGQKVQVVMNEISTKILNRSGMLNRNVRASWNSTSTTSSVTIDPVNEENLQGLGSAFLKTKAAMGRLLG